jgi:hypothetical protein
VEGLAKQKPTVREVKMGKMRVRHVALIVLMASFVVGCTSSPSAPPDNFTATMVAVGMEMPMAKMGKNSRVENPNMNGVVTIVLGEAKKSIMMNPGNKSYFEQSLENREQMPTIHDPGLVFEKKKVGKETIDDHPCIKYEAVYYRKAKPEEKYRAIIWEAQDLKGFPIQTEAVMAQNPQRPGSGGSMVMKYKNIKLGAATPSMFEVPPDYKKVESAQEVMGFGAMGNMGNMRDIMKNMPRGRFPGRQ